MRKPVIAQVKSSQTIAEKNPEELFKQGIVDAQVHGACTGEITCQQDAAKN